MSIKLSYQEQYPNFADLLARYPGLAAWLATLIENRQEGRAEDVLPRFLAECIDQNIPGDAYPFTAEGWALEALRAYLQSAQAEIEAFSELPTSHMETVSRASSERAQISPDALAAMDTQTEIPTPDEERIGGVGDGDKQAASDALTDKDTLIEIPTPHATDGEANDKGEPTPLDTLAEEPLAPRKEGAGDAGDRPVLQEEIAEEDANVKSALKRLSRLFRGKVPFRRKSQRVRRKRTRKQRIISWALLLLILAAVLVPAGFLVSFGVSAYTTYHKLSDEAHSAVNQLLDVKKVFSGGLSHPNEIFDPAKLQRAQADFVASERSFQQLHDQLEQSATLATITTYFPQYRATLSSARAASMVGVDASKIGQIAMSNAIPLAPSFREPLLASSGKALITQPVLKAIGTILDQSLPLLNDIQVQSRGISVDALPISASQKSQLGQVLPILPQVTAYLVQARTLLSSVGWVLGVGQPRTFLVQTMDRAELRAAGGFTGQFGELQVNGGRVAPFSLVDVSKLDYNPTSANQGQLAPEQYRSWWPFPNWGLRDSNASADFPTTAQLALTLYQEETGHQVDGLISFTPIVIEHVLAVIGPIQVPAYGETITAQNLEDRLHYYQLDNGGIYKQYLVNLANGGNASTSARKQFTSMLTTLLLNKLRSESPTVLLALAHQVLADLNTKDLQVYFTDPASEQVLVQYGYAGQLDRSTTHDGLFVVQENLSASKASQYVQTIMHDTVTLNSQGGATHQFQIRLVYNQAGQVYGYDTYFDYLRVYVPPGSQLLSGDGFSSGIPLCGGPYSACPANGPYPGGELTCPAGQYQPGAMPPTFDDPSGADWQPLQTLTGPTNTTSDEPGRAMYGGWVIVPKNCTMNVSLSWYVPPMSQHGYSLLVQRQAGTFPELDLSILPDAATCTQLATAGMHLDTILTEDSSFSPPAYKPVKQGCYPNAGV